VVTKSLPHAWRAVNAHTLWQHVFAALVKQSRSMYSSICIFSEGEVSRPLNLRQWHLSQAADLLLLLAYRTCLHRQHYHRKRQALCDMPLVLLLLLSCSCSRNFMLSGVRFYFANPFATSCCLLLLLQQLLLQVWRAVLT
jgi:hypothetical protein